MDRQKRVSELRSELVQANEGMEAIFAKVETEKRTRTPEEKSAYDVLKKKAEDLESEISDLSDQIKRDMAKATLVDNGASKLAGLPTNKEELGKSDIRNVKQARIGNFFRAANPALGYTLEGVEKELAQHAAKEFKSFSNLPDYDASKGSTIPALALRYMDWTEEQMNRTAEKRDAQATTSALGIELINTDTLSSNYVQALRPQNVLMNAGVRVIQNDSGSNIVFPRENSLYTAAMASTENAAATESLTATNFINPPLTYSPKRGTGYVQVSNQLLLQAGWWEPFLRQQIILGNATLMDVQGINGSGSSGQARGILNTSGIGTVVGGTNGANFSRPFITQFESTVGAAGANLNNCAFITNFSLNAFGKRTEFSTGSGRYLVDSAPMWSWDNGPRGKGAMSLIDQYPTYLSANVPNNLTKGTSTTICSAVIFGDVSKMVYMNFGGLQVIVDPYVNGVNALTNYYVHFWFDFNVILPGAAAVSVDMLTP